MHQLTSFAPRLCGPHENRYSQTRMAHKLTVKGYNCTSPATQGLCSRSVRVGPSQAAALCTDCGPSALPKQQGGYPNTCASTASTGHGRPAIVVLLLAESSVRTPCWWGRWGVPKVCSRLIRAACASAAGALLASVIARNTVRAHAICTARAPACGGRTEDSRVKIKWLLVEQRVGQPPRSRGRRHVRWVGLPELGLRRRALGNAVKELCVVI
jgi:hypothetical protein